MTELEARRHLRLPEDEAIDPQQVKQAYRAAAKLHHPDVGSDPDPQAFAVVAEAADLLKDGKPAPAAAGWGSDTLRMDIPPSSTFRAKYSRETTDVAEVLRTSIEDLFGDLMTESSPPKAGEVTVTSWRYDRMGRGWLVIEGLPGGVTVEVDLHRTDVRITDLSGLPIPHTFKE